MKNKREEAQVRALEVLMFHAPAGKMPAPGIVVSLANEMLVNLKKGRCVGLYSYPVGIYCCPISKDLKDLGVELK